MGKDLAHLDDDDQEEEEEEDGGNNGGQPSFYFAPETFLPQSLSERRRKKGKRGNRKEGKLMLLQQPVHPCSACLWTRRCCALLP